MAVLQVDGMDGEWDNEMAAASVVPMAGMDGCSADKKGLHLIDGLEKNWGYSRVMKAGRVLVVAKGVNWDKKKVLWSVWIPVGERVHYLDGTMAGQKDVESAEN